MTHVVCILAGMLAISMMLFFMLLANRNSLHDTAIGQQTGIIDVQKQAIMDQDQIIKDLLEKLGPTGADAGPPVELY